MKCERIPLGAQGAYLDTYFLADSPELKAGACRPAVVVCPGGGYAYTSDREAEPIALAPVRPRLPRLCAALSLRARPFPRRARAGRSRGLGARGRRGEPCGPAADLRMRFFLRAGIWRAAFGVFWNAPFLAAETGLAPRTCARIKWCFATPLSPAENLPTRGLSTICWAPTRTPPAAQRYRWNSM